MATESWAEKSRALAAAGLVVMGREAQTKIEELTNLSPLIEAATASSTRLLTSQSIDELLTIVPTEETINEAEVSTQRNPQTLQSTLARPETGQAIGRAPADGCVIIKLGRHTKVCQLKRMCRENGVKGYSRANKQQLYQMLMAI